MLLFGHVRAERLGGAVGEPLGFRLGGRRRRDRHQRQWLPRLVHRRLGEHCAGDGDVVAQGDPDGVAVRELGVDLRERREAVLVAERHGGRAGLGIRLGVLRHGAAVREAGLRDQHDRLALPRLAAARLELEAAVEADAPVCEHREQQRDRQAGGHEDAKAPEDSQVEQEVHSAAACAAPDVRDGCFRAVRDTELAVAAREVELDRVRGDAEPARDLAVGEAEHGHLDDLCLARGQPGAGRRGGVVVGGRIQHECDARYTGNRCLYVIGTALGQLFRPDLAGRVAVPAAPVQPHRPVGSGPEPCESAAADGQGNTVEVIEL